MFNRIPTAAMVMTIDEPPTERKGRGSPLVGKRLMTILMLMKA
jgi:hypothetical protein